MANQFTFKYRKTALASREKLVGHGTLTHPDGFGSPIETRRNQPAIEDMSPKT
jgi:phenylalanine-4-hydroxylase